MKKLMILLAVMITSLFQGCTSANFQNDADIVRHRHARYYSNILKEYKEKKGRYPFTNINSKKQTYVFIANSIQNNFVQLPPYDINIISTYDFFNELETVLEKDVKEYYDPQYGPDSKPNFYMYMVQDGDFYLVINVSKPYPYTKKVTDGYHKIEITNDKYSLPIKLVEIEELLNDPTFINECNKKAEKEGFFKAREEKYINETELK